jgi:Tol biopolymer transport system component
MKKMAHLLFFSILIIWQHTLYAQTIPNKKLYLEQPPPGNKPKIFAPGIVSLQNRLETYPAFTPDGKEMFFSVVNIGWTKGTIFHTMLQNDSWTVPDTASFSKNRFINWESSVSPDGKKQFFASNRPPSANMDIWMTERSEDLTWSNPVQLNSPVNSIAQDGSACITGNKNLYFISRRGGGLGGSILYRSKIVDISFLQVENMGGIIKTSSDESEPYMAPDESYLIFISESRPGGYGGWDLWICFRNNDNSWSVPFNMGPEINTAMDEYGPRVTPDGKYLFFTRETRGKDMDIYWVSSSIINKLSQK